MQPRMSVRHRAGAAGDAGADDVPVVGAEDDTAPRDSRRHLDEALSLDPVDEAERRPQAGGHEARSSSRGAEHRPTRSRRRPLQRVGRRERVARERTALGRADRHQAEDDPCHPAHERDTRDCGSECDASSFAPLHLTRLVPRRRSRRLGRHTRAGGESCREGVGALEPGRRPELLERLVRLRDERRGIVLAAL